MNLWNNTHGIGKTNADQQQLVNWMLSHPMPPGDDQAKLGQWFKDYTAFGQSLKKLPGTAGVTTADRDIERAVQSEEAKCRQEGKSEEEIADLSAQRRSQLRTESAGVTGNQREKDESHIEMYDNSMAKIDGVTGVLDKYVGAAGIAGKATRTAERVRDLFGSNDTDRVQMSRDIEYLQAVAPQLLFDRAGRPLASESSRINDIIAGLNMGDTTANTLRSLKELKTLYQKMQADAKKRQPASGGSPARAPRPAKRSRIGCRPSRTRTATRPSSPVRPTWTPRARPGASSTRSVATPIMMPCRRASPMSTRRGRPARNPSTSRSISRRRPSTTCRSTTRSAARRWSALTLARSRRPPRASSMSRTRAARCASRGTVRRPQAAS